MRRAFVHAAFLAALSGCNRESLDVAPDVDLDRFQGKWHEIAHLPRPTQNDCTGTTATYEKQDGATLRFVHECTLADGTYHGSTSIARVRDPRAPAKLEVDFGAHVGDYWIVEIASDYRYAVIGHPSRDYLWILSRTPDLAPDDLEIVLAHAKDKGFDTHRLAYTPHGEIPDGTPAPPVEHGCSMASAAGSGGSPWILALAALVYARRRRLRLTA